MNIKRLSETCKTDQDSSTLLRRLCNIRTPVGSYQITSTSLLTCLLFLLVVGCGQKKIDSTAPSLHQATKSDEQADHSDSVEKTASSIEPQQSAEVIAERETAPSLETQKSAPQSVVEVQKNDAKPDSRATATDPVNDEEHGSPLDLTAYYGTPATAFDNIETYPWRDAPRGKMVLGNISVDIGGMICLWGKKNSDRGLVFPEYIEGIGVERKFESLYLLHTLFHNSPSGTSVVHLIMNYQDGTFQDREICSGHHAMDWLANPLAPCDLEDPQSKLVFCKKSSMHPDTGPKELRFFITEIPNEFPDQLVKSIDLVSSKEASASCILGMTTGNAGLLRDDR